MSAVPNSSDSNRLITIINATDLSGGTIPINDDRESMMAELEASLPPLSKDQERSLRNARVSSKEPEAFDCSFELPAEKYKLGSLFTTISESKSNVTVPHVEPTVSNILASNDESNNGNAFATFESSWIDEVVSSRTPKIQEKTHPNGNRFFSFDNGIGDSAVVVVFDVHGRKMINLSDGIIPLDEFFSVESCSKRAFVDDSSVKNQDLRQLPRLTTEITYCRFKNGNYLFNMSINMFMAILSHLSQIYKADSTNTQTSTVAITSSNTAAPAIFVFNMEKDEEREEPEVELGQKSWFARCFRNRT